MSLTPVEEKILTELLKKKKRTSRKPFRKKRTPVKKQAKSILASDALANALLFIILIILAFALISGGQ